MIDGGLIVLQLTTLTTSELNAIFLSLALLLLAAFLTGNLFEKFRAPRVVGEIAGGIILGASALYTLFPQAVGAIFQGFPEQGKVLNIFYQLGLVFLMLSSGFNTCLAVEKGNRRLISLLLVGATVLPMIAGCFTYHWFIDAFIGPAQNRLSFLLVYLISIAITSIPVISKIFFDLDLMNTHFSNLVLTTSTLQDLLLWILLNLALDLAAVQTANVWNMVFTVCCTIGLFVLAGIMARLMSRVRVTLSGSAFFTLTFGVLFLFIVAMNYLRINIMYSSFIIGYVIKSIANQNPDFSRKMQSLYDFSFAFFIPIYFALVGIQINLIHNFSLLRFLFFFVVAFSLEFLGSVTMLAFTNLKKQSILGFGIIMNARGGPGIVLATVAYGAGIIHAEFFTVLILTTMLSSLLAGYWLRYQKKKDPSIFTYLEKDSQCVEEKANIASKNNFTS